MLVVPLRLAWALWKLGYLRRFRNAQLELFMRKQYEPSNRIRHFYANIPSTVERKELVDIDFFAMVICTII